tara:strand:+ start:51 stop:488 length:438 start_codon:yes stop_codon:yes gene_type:complete
MADKNTSVKETVKLKVATDNYYGTGKRKSSIAKVWIFPGSGRISVNNLEPNEYYKSSVLIDRLMFPLRRLGLQSKYDCVIRCLGGGLVGQADAAALGISRALLSLNSSFRSSLKEEGCLTRDARVKERKKYGKRKARKAPQYRKR